MARYNKIDLGPSTEKLPQVREALAAADTTPGAVVLMAAGELAGATATTALEGVQLYVADAGWCSGLDVDDAVPAGDTLIAHKMLPAKRYAALVATGNNITAVDTPLKVSATAGQLEIGTAGTDHIVAYADEIYNNASGSAQLVSIRPAVL